MTRNRVTSSTLPLTRGVLQGSILGPLLFLLYIDDLPEQLGMAETQNFANDTLYHAGTNNANVDRDPQTALTRLSHWCRTNHPTINVSALHQKAVNPKNQKTESVNRISKPENQMTENSSPQVHSYFHSCLYKISKKYCFIC